MIMLLVEKLKFRISILIQFFKSFKEKRRLKKFVSHDLEFISRNDSIHSAKQGTLIVKCDDIGDFLVWQQVIPQIVENAQKPIHFVGNAVIKSMFEDYFDFPDSCIWIDKSKWADFEYRKSIYAKVNQLNVEHAITPLFTRNFKMDDLIVAASSATLKTAWSRKLHAYFPDFDMLDHSIRNVISTDVPVKLEYFRNIEFINKVYYLNAPEEIRVLFPNFKKYSTLVVVPLASAGSKTWKHEYFTETIKKVAPLFDKIILLGGNNGKEISKSIETGVNDRKLLNLVGQTKLSEVFAFVGESKLLLSLDTFASHVGILTGTPTVLITNGTNHQRFGDYGDYVSSGFRSVLPPHVKLEKDKVKLHYSSSEINTIKVETVVKSIESLLNSTGEGQIVQ